MLSCRERQTRHVFRPEAQRLRDERVISPRFHLHGVESCRPPYFKRCTCRNCVLINQNVMFIAALAICAAQPSAHSSAIRVGHIVFQCGSGSKSLTPSESLRNVVLNYTSEIIPCRGGWTQKWQNFFIYSEITVSDEQITDDFYLVSAQIDNILDKISDFYDNYHICTVISTALWCTINHFKKRQKLQ